MDTCLFQYLSLRGCINCLARLYEPAWNRPLTFATTQRTVDQQNAVFMYDYSANADGVPSAILSMIKCHPSLSLPSSDRLSL